MKPVTVAEADRSPSLQWYWNNREHAKTVMRERRRERAARLHEIKLAHGCVECGYAKNPVALEFDHRPGEVKLFDVSKSPGRNWALTLAEIDKCDVVCANCHQIRTHVRLGSTDATRDQ